MTTFNVLDPQTDIFSHYFLEASAGTGKTFAIENIVPRLLLESKEPPVQLSEILVVTFTRAATRELKSRIYQNLLKIKSALDDREGGPPYIQSLLTSDRETLERAKRRIEEALCFFEKAKVFTLHGFCLKILQEFAFEAKFFLSSKDEEECGQLDKLKEYIKDFLRRGIDPKVLSPAQLKIVVQGVGKEIDALCTAILNRLEGGQKIACYPTAFERYNRWNEILKSLPSVTVDELWHDFAVVAPRLSSSLKRKAQAEAFFKAVEKKNCSFKEWDAVLEEKEFFLEEIRFSAAYQKKSPENRGLIHIDLFEELQNLFVPLYKAAKDYSAILLTLAKACSSHYEKGREDLSHFNPDDLVWSLKSALLRDSIFCKKVQERFKAVIIDEFQDTDPAQWDIFESLFFKENKTVPTLYLVGDPKQSIYAFRRADVYLYLRAASLLGEKSLAYLDTNYRSHPHLVDALNELFSFDLPSHWMILPFLQKGLEVRKVSSKPIYPSSLDTDSKGRVHFFVVEDETEKPKRWPRECIEEEKLFPLIAREISSLRSKNGYTLKQMAILVKDRYQAMRLQKALKEYNIPCLMQKSLDVAGSVAYEVMKDLLIAVERPSSLSALKRFLGGPLIGRSSNDIEGSLENIHLQKAKEFLLEQGNIFRRQGFGVFFQNVLLFPSLNSEKTVVEDLLSREDPHLYFDLRQLCQIILENCPEGLYDPKISLEFLIELRDLPLSSETLRQCSEEEEDQVQVMTLHKSKGLEFDIVFAHGLCSRHTRGDEFISIRKNDGREMAASSQEEDSLSLHLQEIDAEKLRQLYVALTRGKERVYIPIVLSKNPQQIQAGTAAPIELLMGGVGLKEYVIDDVYSNISVLSWVKFQSYLNRLKEKSNVTYEFVDSFRVTAEKIEIPTPVLLKPSQTLPLKTTSSLLLSFSALAEGKKEEGEKVYLEAPLEGDLPLGAETGTVIHAILENICKAGLHFLDKATIRKAVERHSKGSCLEGLEERVFQLIEDTFNAPIPLQKGLVTLSKIPSSDMQTEIEFLYPFPPSYLKGFIDLVFRYQGRYYILDWKTNYLGPNKEDYSLEKIEECMKKSDYFLQASIYSEALKKYLALFDKRPFETLFGGAVYFFMRGTKPYLFQPVQGESLCKTN